MPIQLVHKQTTAAVRATFRMVPPHVYARLMGSGLEVNQLVKVGIQCCVLGVYEWCVWRAYGMGCSHILWVLFSIVIALHFTAILCANLSHPLDGTVAFDANIVGSQANYSCSEGYILNGITTRVCQADGQWSGSEPTCEGQFARFYYCQCNLYFIAVSQMDCNPLKP